MGGGGLPGSDFGAPANLDGTPSTVNLASAAAMNSRFTVLNSDLSLRSVAAWNVSRPPSIMLTETNWP